MNVQSHQHTSYSRQLPLDFHGWTGERIKVDKRTEEILETNDILMCNYKREDKTPVQLCIVYASNNRKVSHPPEVCYKGSGWSLEDKGSLLLVTQPGKKPEFQVMKLVVEKGGQKHLVLYWYKCNDEYTGNYYKQQLNIVKKGIMNGKSTSGMIRLSTHIDENEEVSKTRMQKFFIDLLPLLTEYLP